MEPHGYQSAAHPASRGRLSRPGRVGTRILRPAVQRHETSRFATGGTSSLGVAGPSELTPNVLANASCVLVVSHGMETTPSAAQEMHAYVTWLRSNVATPKLLALCSWQDYDPILTDEILKTPNELTPLAVAQQSPVTAREGGLLFLKFFTELALHSENEMDGRMVWFAWSKAKEVLKRRRLEGRFGVRA